MSWTNHSNAAPLQSGAILAWQSAGECGCITNLRESESDACWLQCLALWPIRLVGPAQLKHGGVDVDMWQTELH